MIPKRILGLFGVLVWANVALAQRTSDALLVHRVARDERVRIASSHPQVEYRVFIRSQSNPLAVGARGALRVLGQDPGGRYVDIELFGPTRELSPVALVALPSACVPGFERETCAQLRPEAQYVVLHPWLDPFEVPRAVSALWDRASPLLLDDRVIFRSVRGEMHFAALARDGTYVPFRLREAPSPADAWYGVHGRVLYYPTGGALRVHDWRAREEREVEGARPGERVSRVCEDGHQAVYVTLLDTATSRARVARLTAEGRLEHVLDVPSPFLVSCLRGGGFVSMAVGSRELVHADRRGQHRWQLASPIGSAGAWRQSPPQITEWLWVIGQGEIDMVDLQPLFAWTPLHPREPPEETPEPARAD